MHDDTHCIRWRSVLDKDDDDTANPKKVGLTSDAYRTVSTVHLMLGAVSIDSPELRIPV